ncbi:Cobalamin biosynthesis protein CobD [wastewater metagenome]|uniref:Cobalamin biosynthesis protein CobD n=2 Tax=unclassified sequences TaxID=12908 RepID=A0A5B8RI32_9ZZZZ|nr:MULTISPECIES: CobD/CbiB family cobalamin biosynthesis protein [Arhodomonas]MCS4505249.1 cobalamin biosynthesis protein [Arhodomonas aquaeolei]QEA07312.1 cobalamin biosynthesis protein CobD [uncultured organism]
MTAALACALAVALDRLLPEPRRHPLNAFAAAAAALEGRLNDGHRPRVRGAFAVAALLVPAAVIAALPGALPIAGPVASVALLWLALGGGSLAAHGSAVAAPLAAGDLSAARAATARMVGRDTDVLDADGCAVAAAESVLENGHDAVFGTLFWFVVAGPAGAVVYRLANTLDALWGHRNARFARFGTAAARLDDMLGFVPARLTAATYALLGDRRGGWRHGLAGARGWPSGNAGAVMGAGAGALGMQLGGAASYHGVHHERPTLGAGPAPDAGDLHRAVALVDRGTAAWLMVITLGAGLG